MKCRIFLDTNKVYTDKEESLKEVFNSNIKRLNKFINDNNVKEVTLCLPEVVVKERIQQKIDNIQFNLQGANQRIKILREIGHRIKEIKPKKDYRKKLKQSADLFIKNESIEIVPVPKIESEELIERALQKTKPFKNKDTGFKDTLIFLTLVNDALKKKADKYILCTDNLGDFCEDVKIEFKNKTGKELIIIPGIIELEETLDNLYTLRLKRKERDETIKNTIFKKIGEVMLAINKNNIKEDSSYDPFSTHLNLRASAYDSISLYGSQTDQDEIVGYDFEDIHISDISEVSQFNFKVGITVNTKIRHKNENKNTYPLRSFGAISFGDNDYFNRRNNHKTFTVQINCNIQTEDFSLQSIYPTF